MIRCTVLGRRAEQRAVERVPAQEQVEVVLEGDADATVQLHAVLQQLEPYSPMNAFAVLASLPPSGAVGGHRASRRRR